MELLDTLNYLKKFLHMEREVVGLQQLKEEPPAEEIYGDKNHICYMIGEVLEEGKTFCTILENHVCLLGCAATGLDPGLTTLGSKDRSESDQFHVSGINIFPNEEIQGVSEKEAALLFPEFKEVCKAIRLGPLAEITEPEVAVFIATPEQVHMLTRAYCYGTGHFIKGYAGMGACRMLFPHAFLDNEPTFTVSDRSWRNALKLNKNELTLVFPTNKLQVIADNIDEANKEWSR